MKPRLSPWIAAAAPAVLPLRALADVTVPQLQFVDVAVLSLLALLAAGAVLLLKALRRREEAEDAGEGAALERWRAMTRRWRRRYALSAAALVAVLLMAGLAVFHGAAG